MAKIQFEDIEVFTINGESLDETEVVSIRSPEPEEPYWQITYRDGTTVIAEGQVFIRGKMLDSSLIPTKEELDV